MLLSQEERIESRDSVHFGKLRTAAAMLHGLLVPERMLGRK
jgi:hypothetical protein